MTRSRRKTAVPGNPAKTELSYKVMREIIFFKPDPEKTPFTA